MVSIFDRICVAKRNIIFSIDDNECAEGEEYVCKNFEPSCNQFLYDGEKFDSKCDVMVCACDIGFVRVKGECVLKEACCEPGRCLTRKEKIIGPLRLENAKKKEKSFRQ